MVTRFFPLLSKNFSILGINHFCGHTEVFSLNFFTPPAPLPLDLPSLPALLLEITLLFTSSQGPAEGS